jgi:hypothetical protein
MSKLRKFLSLRADEQRLIARCVVLVALVRLSLNCFSLNRVMRGLKRLAGKRKPEPIGEMDFYRIVWAVSAASKVIPRATCLTQALAAQTLLGRRGTMTQLRLGVRRESGQFRAHAWLEWNGKVVIGDDGQLSRYSTLPLSGEGIFPVVNEAQTRQTQLAV